MKRWRWVGWGLLIPVLASVGSIGCSKAPETGLPSTASAPAARSENSPRSTQTAARPPAAAPAAPQRLAVPAGTTLRVVLDQSISTASARSGDSFRATLIEPVIVAGTTVIPKHASVEGHIVEARSSGRLKGVARLVLTLDAVEIGGHRYELQTTTVSRVGQSHKTRNIEIIGGGSALGAIIGGIAGGGKGAAIGAAAGAGAGTATAAATGKKEVQLPAEATLVFRLKAPVEIEVHR